MESNVADEVVPASAAATSTAHESMVTKTVKDTITKLALGVFRREAHAQPPPKHSNEKGRFRLEPRCFAGRSGDEVLSLFVANKAQVSTTRLGSAVFKLSKGALPDGLRQDPLRKTISLGRTELVVVVDATIVGLEGNILWGKVTTRSRLKRVGWVQKLAKPETACPGSQKSRVAVLGDRPEAKTAAASAKSSLRPLLFIRVEAGELLKAGAHVGVEGFQGS